MVLLHVKQNEEDLFLYETKLQNSVKEVTDALVQIQNGRLKIERLCAEIGLLVEHGVALPPSMHGLLEDQIRELNLEDELEGKYDPAMGFDENKDPCNKRNGRRPNESMREVLRKTCAEAKGLISKQQLKSGISLSDQHIQDGVSILRGGINVVYPDDIPPFDPIRMEFENREELSGSQEEQRVLAPLMTVLWFAGKELDCSKNLSEYFGKNEKTKVVVKLQKKGCGPPIREPFITDEEKKKLLLSEFRRREELKKLEEDLDNSYLGSDWADNHHLKKSFHGIRDVTWKPH